MIKNIAICLILLQLPCMIIAQKTIKLEGKVYNLGINSKDMKMDVLTKEMLVLHVDITYTFRINENDVMNLHNELGANYDKLFCEPVVKDAVRKVFGSYTMEEILSNKREQISIEITQTIHDEFIKYHIQFGNIYIKNIVLPEPVKASIEAKLVAEQESQKQNYLKEVEAKKLEISKIKAKAIAEYNHMMDSSLTEKILQLKYIEALEKFAESNNTKVIIVGNEKIELPQILNEDK